MEKKASGQKYKRLNNENIEWQNSGVNDTEIMNWSSNEVKIETFSSEKENSNGEKLKTSFNNGHDVFEKVKSNIVYRSSKQKDVLKHP